MVIVGTKCVKFQTAEKCPGSWLAYHSNDNYTPNCSPSHESYYKFCVLFWSWGSATAFLSCLSYTFCLIHWLKHNYSPAVMVLYTLHFSNVAAFNPLGLFLCRFKKQTLILPEKNMEANFYKLRQIKTDIRLILHANCCIWWIQQIIRHLSVKIYTMKTKKHWKQTRKICTDLSLVVESLNLI